MNPEQLGRLFVAFAQADGSTSRKDGGSGLGLALSRKFCQMLGGDLTVVSEFGKGSSFTATLPARAPEVLAYPAALPSTAPASSADGVQILVIDDDPAVRELMQRFLAKEGYHVVTASDGAQGLALARQIKPAVITLDVLMPGVDGWTVLTQLKHDPALADIPVILVTITDDQTMGFTLGASET